MKKRNYAVEYKRRIARGKARGYSKAVARGHALQGTLGIRAAKFLGESPGFKVKVKPGSKRSLRDAVLRDAEYVFGEAPVRGFDDGSAPEYQLRLEQLASRPGVFNWQNERAFVEKMMALGLTERAAYSHWFSPGGAST